MARRKITVYLPADLEACVQRIARDLHRSQSSVVTEAVRSRWARIACVQDQQEPAGRLLPRIDARLDKAIGETLVVKEIVLLFVRVWLEHNPPIDEVLEERAAASAQARFERFLDFVAQALAPGSAATPTAHTLAALSDGVAVAGEVCP